MELPVVVRLTATPATDPCFQYIGQGAYQCAIGAIYPVPKIGDVMVVTCTDPNAEIRANDLAIWSGAGDLVVWCGKLSTNELTVHFAESYTVKHYALIDYHVIRGLNRVYQNIQGRDVEYYGGSISFPSPGTPLTCCKLKSFPDLTVLQAQLSTLQRARANGIIEFD